MTRTSVGKGHSASSGPHAEGCTLRKPAWHDVQSARMCSPQRKAHEPGRTDRAPGGGGGHVACNVAKEGTDRPSAWRAERALVVSAASTRAASSRLTVA